MKVNFDNFKLIDTTNGNVVFEGKTVKTVNIGRKKYTLWFYDFKDSKWINLPVNDSIDNVLKELKRQLSLTINNQCTSSIFKIAEQGEIKWQKYIPSYLLER